MADSPLTLGSASPRRAMLLRRLGVDFEIRSVDIDETRFGVAGDPVASVRAIAAAKFAALAPRVEVGALITADTLVSIDGQAMGKPGSNAELQTMLAAMSASTIAIDTGVCVGTPSQQQPATTSVRTLVGLRALSSDDIETYVGSGAGMDKAGGLALQAEAAHFIESVDGCWSNVVGLPLCAVAELLAIDPTLGGQPDRCSVALCGRSQS